METLRMILAWPILASVIIFVIWRYFKWKEVNFKNECEYEKVYEQISRNIDTVPVSEGWYDELTLRLTELGQMKWKNPEKTHVLSCKFWRKFTKIRLRRFIDNKEVLGIFDMDEVIIN